VTGIGTSGYCPRCLKLQRENDRAAIRIARERRLAAAKFGR